MLFSAIFSISSVESLLLTIIVCFLTLKLWQQRPKNSPPGTNGYPLVGVIFSLGRYTEKTMTKWAKQYGPIYMTKVGMVDVVVISSPEIAYEAHAKCDSFNDRPMSNGAFSDGKGVVFIDRNDIHVEQRRFSLNTLRLLGMGRRNLEPQLIQLSNDLCEKIDAHFIDEKSKSKPIDIQPMIYDLLSSVISCMIFGSDIPAESEEFNKLLKILGSSNYLSFLGSIILFAPFLKYVFPFSYVWRKGVEFQCNMRRAILKQITKHSETLDLENPRDFIDCFLIEMEKFKQGRRKILLSSE